MQNISTSSNKYRLFSSSSFFYNLFLLWVHSRPNRATSLALEIVKGTDWWSLPTGTRVNVAARGIGLASITMRGLIESANWPKKKNIFHSRWCNGLPIRRLHYEMLTNHILQWFSFSKSIACNIYCWGNYTQLSFFLWVQFDSGVLWQGWPSLCGRVNLNTSLRLNFSLSLV